MSKTALKSRRRRVLVVEPDGEFCSLLCEFLQAQKFEVDVAHDADHCLKMVDGFKPDVILLSRELPMNGGTTVGPDGLRVLKTVKQDRKTRIPVIMFSGEASEADFDRYRKLKFTADDYLKKPFEDTEILRRIENQVGFDFSDDIDRLQENIDDAMDDPLAKLFDADPEELGSSSATRKEVSRLLEQVGRELERQEDTEAAEEPVVATPAAAPKPVEAGSPDKEEIGRLKAELLRVTHQLEVGQKQLVSERKRSREIKKEWKQRLTEIESELKKSEDRESRMREEFEKMRFRFADMELDHTLELERVQAEKRRALEDVARLQAMDYPPEQVAEDLRRAAALLEEMLKKLSG